MAKTLDNHRRSWTKADVTQLREQICNVKGWFSRRVYVKEPSC